MDLWAEENPQCHVYGVERLRVGDTGSFLFVPPSHVQSIAYMLAEKTADSVKNEN